MPAERGYRGPVRHVLFALLVALYVVVVAQNWAVYAAALLIALWVRQRGRLRSVPFTLGRRWKDRTDREEPHR